MPSDVLPQAGGGHKWNFGFRMIPKAGGVRHPIYSGLLLMILGTVLLAGQLGGLIAFVICFFGFWMKLKLEERLLSRQFSDTYPQYMARTKALVPFIL